jgi:predicted nucleic acid-binding protein
MIEEPMRANCRFLADSCLLILLPLVLALAPATSAAERPRVVVLTDISNEPDDEESMVRFLVYSNELDVEGLIATTSTHLRDRTREDLIRRQIEAYARVRENLAKHAPGFPTPDQLLAVTHTGQPGYGMEAVGEGKSSAGSRHIVEVVDRDDDRPVWISVWGGANTLAQALRDVRETRSPAELKRFVARLRVYTISDQDDAGRWMRLEFPGLFYIVSPSNTHWKEYWRATWTGISGDRHYANGPFHAFELVDNPWLERNVIEGHGPLGALYPRLEYIMEGDTPSFLGLIDNGLGWSVSPAYGGWGGRYVLYQSYAEARPIWTNNMDSRDTVTADDGHAYTSDMATIWRWREHFQHDFAARMDWCVAATRDDANHNPVAALNGDASKSILEIEAKPGESVTLSADGSSDPDGDRVTTSWFVYREAGTHGGAVTLSHGTGPETRMVAPTVDKPETVHVILQLEDQGDPHLYAYRRAIVTVTP